MRLIDGLKLKGRPVEIPDCSRDDLPSFFKEMGYKVGAEIGVDRGEFSEKICSAGLSLYGIDPWKSYNDYKDFYDQTTLDSYYQKTKQLFESYTDCKIIRKTSMEAVGDFTDNSLDFVYIDGNHLLKYVVEDITEWTKKVKPGGCIAGHDYFYTMPRTPAGVCHVIYAVQAYTEAYSIKNWYLIGSKHPKPGEIRDRWRSWMFIKP